MNWVVVAVAVMGVDEEWRKVDWGFGGGGRREWGEWVMMGRLCGVQGWGSGGL
ncbi:hypothetical protein Scep_018549 [Stephania cephalantha]|uniref:Uncharacterized protein n=1 Tax=Stephania cephalantha TaxID=152367 RepID=A0AAP0I9B9_9MAGN